MPGSRPFVFDLSQCNRFGAEKESSFLIRQLPLHLRKTAKTPQDGVFIRLKEPGPGLGPSPGSIVDSGR